MSRIMSRIIRASVVLLATSSLLLFAADCPSLKNLQLPNTTITLAETVTSGTIDLADAPPLHDLPAFCRVAGELHPTSDSRIRFEVWLPTQSWNGRLLGTGNGGFAGSIYYQQFAGYLKRGFAVSGTDAGHQAESTDASWAFNHPEKIKDFGWRAIHLTAATAKQITDTFYSKPADKSYFDACSDGGREALMEAQRFPDDYDGILAGAPANAWSTMLAAGAGAMQALMDNPAAYIPDRKLAFLEKASLAACDKLDGVKDHVIGDPSKCHFDPQVLLCKGEDASDCLTQPQIDAVKSIYAGSKDQHGAVIFPGFTMGDETSWKVWLIGDDPGAALGPRFVENYFRYMVTGDPKANILAASVDDLLRQSRAKEAANLDATNPDLSRFAARGGKLILYHGWNDPAISPYNTVAYFESVEKQMGADKVDTFARLYMIPGTEHCAQGPGASAFGQFGMESAAGPKYGLFDALQDWVEKGSPDPTVIATKYKPGKASAMEPDFTRPLCPWPEVAHYTGSGDPSDAANFSCSAAK
ncbi:MAG TPA: tannase/feruloyl esterase family alpha/beta hydrolase [Acidobacteriaceae bacterium]|jgi:feruloyl esterase|nr:tannase/feruloyl esterase family alpha/beta hydrolase [Acidobacteriaceae bacterium]